MKEIIYFDIDNTLINTKTLAYIFYKQIARKIKLSVDAVIGISDLYMTSLVSSTDFHPNDLMKFVALKTGADYEELISILENESIYKKALFPETISVLESLKNNFRLGTYSQGFEDYQIKKMVFSGIFEYLDPSLIIIERRKTAPEVLNKIEPGSTIVEDKKDVIEELKNHDEFETVWINRLNDEKVEGVRTIKNLIEIT